MRKCIVISITIALIVLLCSSGALAGARSTKQDLTQVPKDVSKVITYPNGKTICTKKDPRTQCDIGVSCANPNEERKDDIPLYTLLKQGSKFKLTVPGQACATFDLENVSPTNPCHCSGRRCWC
jgi:hypothetical protein